MILTTADMDLPLLRYSEAKVKLERTDTLIIILDGEETKVIFQDGKWRIFSKESIVGVPNVDIGYSV